MFLHFPGIVQDMFSITTVMANIYVHNLTCNTGHYEPLERPLHLRLVSTLPLHCYTSDTCDPYPYPS